jgi:hypothetical protein
VLLGANNKLARVRLAAVDDRRDLRIVVVEDVAQQEGGALDGGEPLEHY